MDRAIKRGPRKRRRRGRISERHAEDVINLLSVTKREERFAHRRHDRLGSVRVFTQPDISQTSHSWCIFVPGNTRSGCRCRNRESQVFDEKRERGEFVEGGTDANWSNASLVKRCRSRGGTSSTKRGAARKNGRKDSRRTRHSSDQVPLAAAELPIAGPLRALSHAERGRQGAAEGATVSDPDRSR